MTDLLTSFQRTLSATVVSGIWLLTSLRSVFLCYRQNQHSAHSFGQTYGLVPQPLYPESFHSSSSAPLNTLLKTKLREDALTLRALSATLRADPSVSSEQTIAALRAKKEELMQEIYTVMTAALGVPPKPDVPFKWEYYNEDGKYSKWEGTPIEFYKAFTTKYSVRSLSLDMDKLSF